ncbi:MAG: DUF4034 domain-containing protein [Armatimonadetes bacterium]|nr:DUF4034 domain-containing protein [Armatimonadota bacterium]
MRARALFLILCMLACTACQKPDATPSPKASEEPTPVVIMASPTKQARPLPQFNREIVAAVLKGSIYVSEVVALRALSAQVLDLFARERWDDLETMAEEFRAKRSTYASPMLKISRFYESFRVAPGDENRFLYRIGAWRAAKPDSATALMAEANAQLGLASAGNKAALKGARASAEAALKKNPAEIEAIMALMDAAALEGGNAKAMEALYKRGLAIDPAYVPLHVKMALSLFPAESGKMDAWAAFATRTADRTKEFYGDELYAILISTSGGHDPKAVFSSTLISWPRAKNGFTQLTARYPNSLNVLSAFCFAACLAQDAPAAQALFDRIGDMWLPEIWGTRANFAKLRAWAYGEGAAVRPTADPQLKGYRAAFTVSGGSEAQMPRNATFQATEMRLQLRDLWERERYAELEGVADALRNEIQPLASIVRLETFYAGMRREGQGFSTVDDFRAFVAGQDAWKKAIPTSTTARLVTAEGWMQHAWDARGNATGEQVTEEALKAFNERMAGAKPLLEDAEKQVEEAGVKDPHLYSAMIAHATATAGSIETVNALFEKGMELNLQYSPLYLEKAAWLLPRWHGKEGDVEKFAGESVEKTKADTGIGMYAIVTRAAYTYLGNATFTETKLSWPDTKKGFEDLERLSPESLRLNLFARIACAAGDRETARGLLQHIDTDWEPSVWGTRLDLENWKKWVDKGGDPPKPAF